MTPTSQDAAEAMGKTDDQHHLARRIRGSSDPVTA
jgi:hypothetical protein